jgi:hypothetical protein
MAKQETTSRAKSDTLYWWVQKMSLKAINALKADVEASNKHHDKLELILYYKGLKTWSREAELERYPMEKKSGKDDDVLRKLKYRTFEWASKRLSVLGDWQNDDLHGLIGEIRLQMHYGLYSDVLDRIQEAKNLARERELYAQLRELLGLEITAASKALRASELQGRIAKILSKIEEVDTAVAELAHFDHLRLRYMLKLRAQFELDGSWNAPLASKYRKELEKTPIPSKNHIRATIQYHWHFFFVLLRSGETDSLLGHGWELVILYARCAWLSSDEIEEYANVLMRMVGILAVAKDIEGTENCLDHMQRWINSDSLIAYLTMERVIFAHFFVADELHDLAKAQIACDLFDLHKELIKNRMIDLAYIWVLHYYISFKIWVHSPERCLEILEEADKMKSATKPALLANFRAYRVIAMYLTAPKSKLSAFGITSSSALKYLAELGTDTLAQTIVIEALEKISKLISGGQAALSVWEEANQKLAKIKATENAPSMRHFDFHDFWQKNLDQLLRYNP